MLLLAGVRVSGWSPASPDALPVTSYAPRTEADRSSAQTLAHGTFEADGGAFAWEVFGFPELTSGGLHSFQYRIHRTGGSPTYVWPTASLMLAAGSGNLGETPLNEDATIEEGVLVIRQGYQPRGPGAEEFTALVRLRVVRDLAVGSLTLDPLEVRLPFRVELR